ncbi:MAG: PIN domain-containing protein [Pseudobdellovibrionaceae bacterium]|nr:PIN domain-containing protein [Bdellovibrionales bacterium]USN47932.1 MAG: PIN domain-containing protein [Pseudobdellovibrionaceae bacterium]
MILVDTCIWSEALRKNHSKNHVAIEKFARIISENQVAIIGAIRQELLSGIKEKRSIIKLKDHLRYFPDIELSERDYELAAEYFNQCQRKGVQGSNTDFLICSVANRLKLPIFTLDKDFKNFQKILKIKLF